MSKQIIRNYEYHVWANKRVFQRLGQLPEDILYQQMTNVFPSIYEALVHIYRVDTVWLSGMNGTTYEQTKMLLDGIAEKTTGKNLEQFESLYAELAEEYSTYLQSGANLQAIKQFPHPVYGVLNTNTEELIQHIVNHGTYHRGNITSMLRQLGHAGASSDYVFYLYELDAP